MTRSRLQLDADRHCAALRRTLAEDLGRLREDAGASRAAVAGLAGIHPSVVSRIEAGVIDPTLETYARIAAALGADFAARLYPQSGPAIRDRHQVRMAELVLASAHPRWHGTPEVAVRRPVRGWIDLALHDPVARTLVAAELESGLRRIEQLVRWSSEKANALTSSSDVAGMEREPGPSRRSRACSSCAGPARTAMSRPPPGASCARPTRRIPAMPSRPSPAPRRGPVRPSCGQGSTRGRPASSMDGRGDEAPGVCYDEAITAARASANGSRLAEVNPATLIRPLPTT